MLSIVLFCFFSGTQYLLNLDTITLKYHSRYVIKFKIMSNRSGMTWEWEIDHFNFGWPTPFSETILDWQVSHGISLRSNVKATANCLLEKQTAQIEIATFSSSHYKGVMRDQRVRMRRASPCQLLLRERPHRSGISCAHTALSNNLHTDTLHKSWLSLVTEH